MLGWAKTLLYVAVSVVISLLPLFLLKISPFWPDKRSDLAPAAVVFSVLVALVAMYVDYHDHERWAKRCFWACVIVAAVCLVRLTWFFFNRTEAVRERRSHFWNRIVVGAEYTQAVKDDLAARAARGEDRPSREQLLYEHGNKPDKICTPESLQVARVSGLVVWFIFYTSLAGVLTGALVTLRMRRRRHEIEEEVMAVPTDAVGVHPISVPDNARFNVVFLHGVDGHWRETWQAGGDETFWPAWVARDFPDAAVYSVHYLAATLAWKGPTMPLTDRARNILFLLTAEKMLQRPTAFIAHSFGGLVVKQLWRLVLDRQGADPTMSAVKKSICAVVFLATPHVGSRLADYLRFLLVQAIARPTVTVKDLESSAPQLRDLSEWYINHPIKENLVFYETQPLGTTRVSLVVDEASAMPSLPGLFPSPVDANHITICKPQSNDAPLYKAVKNFLNDKMPRPRRRTKPR